MRKTILFVLLLLVCQTVFAGIVTREQARRVAADFFTSAEIKTRAVDTRPDEFRLICTFPEVETRAPLDPAMYIFERSSGGYAIVSGDDVARPVLGYSLRGRFPITDIPDNMREILQWYTDIIEYARTNHWENPSELISTAQASEQKKLLNTANWGRQYSPFNDLVPKIGDKTPPIGCVPTAIAIVMRYHKWPNQGTGTLPSYDYSDYHIEGFPLDHSYDWDVMPTHSHYNSYSSEGRSQIARLFYDIAVMCQTKFEIGGSGAVFSTATRLVKYFGYDKQMRYLIRNNYPVDNISWERMIKDEIDAERPVLYSGFSKSLGGHAFVIDGYIDRFFSMRAIGWRFVGYNNPFDEPYPDGEREFFTLSPIDGYEKELASFNLDQSMITHIMPDKGGVENPSFYLYNNCISFLAPSFQLNKLFTLQSRIQTTSEESFGSFRYDLLDSNNQLKETVSQIQEGIIRRDYYYPFHFECKITKPLSDGDKVVMVSRNPITGEWSPVIASRRHRIVFTARPLSELIEVGYVEPTDTYEGQPKDIAITFYKDICWDLWDNQNNQSYGIYKFYECEWADCDWADFSIHPLDPEDSESDWVIVSLPIPSGSYTLRAYNPVTGERMEVLLEL